MRLCAFLLVSSVGSFACGSAAETSAGPTGTAGTGAAGDAGGASGSSAGTGGAGGSSSGASGSGGGTSATSGSGGGTGGSTGGSAGSGGASGVVDAGMQSDAGGGGGTRGGAGGTGGVGSDGGSACSQLAADVAQPVTIRIENATDAAILIADSCYAPGPSEVRIDGRAVLDAWYSFGCDDVLAGRCFLGPGCLGAAPVEVKPHATYEVIWSGHLVDEGPQQPVSRACDKHSQTCGATTYCSRRLAASPGEHVLAVTYGATDGGAGTTIEKKFTLPTAMVTVTIAR